MTYAKTIELLNKIYSAEIEKARYSDPTRVVGLNYGELDKLKKQAMNLEKDYRRRQELKQIIDINDYENYFSEKYEKKKEIFLKLIESNELYETFLDEREEASKIANESIKSVSEKILKAQHEINNIIENTNNEVQEDLNKIKEIETNENYLLRSEVPIHVPYLAHLSGGLQRYVDYIDDDVVRSSDEKVVLMSKKRPIKPALEYIGKSHRFNFKYNNCDIRKEILKGVNKHESIR